VKERLVEAGSLRAIAPADTGALRSDMYMIGEAARLFGKSETLADEDRAAMKTVNEKVQASTRFIPNWVKIAVAFALGLGTMVGWKRIVITVGERIGKSHMTYAQGAAAETTAAITILTAQQFGLPV